MHFRFEFAIYMERLAIISTVKAPLNQIQMYINYHLNLGVDEIILFFDNPIDEGIQFFENHQNVTVVSCSEQYWLQREGTRPHLLPDRQIVNVNEGVKIAIKKNCRWITHIDCDELIQPLTDVKKILLNCRADALRFRLLEAVSDQEFYEHIFMPTLFKKESSNLQIWTAKILGLSKLFYQNKYFRGHKSSKMVIKVSSKIEKYGIHKPDQCDHNFIVKEVDELRLLHYYCIGFSNWASKFEERAQELLESNNLKKHFVNYSGPQFQDYLQARNEGDQQLVALYRRLHKISKREQQILFLLGMLEEVVLSQDFFDRVC